MKLKFVIFFLIFTNVLSADERVGSQHMYGLSLLGSYEYEETQLMHLRGGLQGSSKQHENFGFIYNYKNSFLTNGYFTELEFDNQYQDMKQSYWSNSTGTMKDIDVQVFNSRLLYGLNVSDKLMLKSGLGYRHLYHYWQNRTSTTGHYGYDREQEYIYIPLIAELDANIPELNIEGELKIEFDQIIEGQNNSYLGYLGGSNVDKEFKNDDGYMWKVSYLANFTDYIIEPYYEFMSIEESTLNGGSYEPSNTTKEFGVRFKSTFKTNKTSEFSKYKTLLDNDNYYFGLQILKSKIESGFYDTTGTAKIDEEDGYGYSLISGVGLSEFIDLEFAFNQFNQSLLGCNNGDTVKTDGRYSNNLYSAGTTLTCSANDISIIIESYSTAVGVKPKYEYSSNNLDLIFNFNLGYHRWDQSENTVTKGVSSTVVDHTGIDPYYGLGISTNYNNFDFDISYLEHDMFYDAKSLGASLSYKF